MLKKILMGLAGLVVILLVLPLLLSSKMHITRSAV